MRHGGLAWTREPSRTKDRELIKGSQGAPRRARKQERHLLKPRHARRVQLRTYGPVIGKVCAFLLGFAVTSALLVYGVLSRQYLLVLLGVVGWVGVRVAAGEWNRWGADYGELWRRLVHPHRERALLEDAVRHTPHRRGGAAAARP